MKNVALFVGNDIFSAGVPGSDRRPERRVCLYGVFSPAKSAGRTQEPAVRRPGCMSAKC